MCVSNESNLVKSLFFHESSWSNIRNKNMCRNPVALKNNTLESPDGLVCVVGGGIGQGKVGCIGFNGQSTSIFNMTCISVDISH